MANQYRTFKRISMSAKTAKVLRNRLVDLTFEDHYMKCDGSTTCYHAESGSLAVSRFLESALRVGKRRAHLDLTEDRELIGALVTRLRDFAPIVLWAGRAFQRIADEAEIWAKRGPLERLAETADG